MVAQNCGKEESMKLFLIMVDGSRKEFGIGDSTQSIINAVRRNDVEVIVFGEVKDVNVVWEKQFKPVTVMPTSFGKGGQK